MRQVLAMMWVDLRLLRRDSMGLFFTFLLPLGVAAGGTTVSDDTVTVMASSSVGLYVARWVAPS